jgi:hypothetical protein
MRIGFRYAIEEIVSLHKTAKRVPNACFQKKMVRRVLVGMTPKYTLTLLLVVRVLACDCDFIPSRWEIHGTEAISELDLAIWRNVFDGLDAHARLFTIVFDSCSN